MKGIRLRSPAAVAVALALAGVTGGTGVYLAGRGIDQADRRAYLRWEAEALAQVETARAVHQSLPGHAERLAPGAVLGGEQRAALAARLTRGRASLEDAREAILAIPLPEVVKPTAAPYLDAIAQTLIGVSELQSILSRPGASREAPLGAYRTAYARAAQRFSDGDAALARLTLRLGLDG